MREKCKNCKLRLDLEKYDYSKGGCAHTRPDGFICLAFAYEGVAIWMYGSKGGGCECYLPKDGMRKEKENESVQCAQRL